MTSTLYLTTFQEIAYFFETYKVLEGKQTRVPGLKDKECAKQVIKEAIERYNEKFPNN